FLPAPCSPAPVRAQVLPRVLPALLGDGARVAREGLRRLSGVVRAGMDRAVRRVHELGLRLLTIRTIPRRPPSPSRALVGTETHAPTDLPPPARSARGHLDRGIGPPPRGMSRGSGRSPSSLPRSCPPQRGRRRTPTSPSVWLCHRSGRCPPCRRCHR